MSKHAAPTVIRYWPGGCFDLPSINAFVTDWNDGTFSLPSGHPLAVDVLQSVMHRVCHITIASEEEVHWVVDRVDVRYDGRSYLTCIPARNHMMLSLRTDEWLVEQGLVS